MSASSPDLRKAAGEAHEAAWMVRDLCTVLAQALTSRGESFGPPLLDALSTVAHLAEEHAERAKEAAWIATGHTFPPQQEGAKT